ncbi:MAG: methyltransferase [bacterium]|nr:methyltransferase [bacterium]
MTLPDGLSRTTEMRGDEIWFGFANGLRIRTDSLANLDSNRVLSLGTPQGALMNHLVHHPETARGKRVLEPFGGSGALGFMALKVGAAHVDFLDINPRACEFQRGNAAENAFGADTFDVIEGDIATFEPEAPYDLLIANPPFVPTPDGIPGTLTSNGGPEGNRFVEILLQRLEALLAPTGRALIYVLQFVVGGKPLVARLIHEQVGNRPVVLTPSQEHLIPLDAWCGSYARLFPDDAAVAQAWHSELALRHGSELSLCHYVIDIGPRSSEATSCVVRHDFAAKFGTAFFVPSDPPEELALGRVFENVRR